MGGGSGGPPSEDDLVGKAAAQLLVRQNNRVQDEHLSRDPDSAACSVGEGTNRGPWGAEVRAGGRGPLLSGGIPPCPSRPGLLPPATRPGTGTQRALGKRLLKETATRLCHFSPQSPPITCGGFPCPNPPGKPYPGW